MNKTRKKIFEAAIIEFSQNGYNKATMDTIAETAGLAKGTLYYNFKSKEELFKYIIAEGMQLITNEIEEAAKKEDNILDRLRQICKLQLNIIHRNRNFFKVVMSQLWGNKQYQKLA